MKTVKILSGGYGLKSNGRTHLVLKGEICNVDDDEAKRLVDIGAAVIVGDTEQEAEKPVVPEGAPAPAPADDDSDDEPTGDEDEESNVDDDEDEEEIDLTQKTNAELIEICKGLKINTKTLTNKTKLINAIKAKQDEMPDLGAEEFE